MEKNIRYTYTMVLPEDGKLIVAYLKDSDAPNLALFSDEAMKWKIFDMNGNYDYESLGSVGSLADIGERQDVLILKKERPFDSSLV